MKRIILLIVVMIGFLSTMIGQTYYNMWRGYGSSGKSEWLANFDMRTDGNITGIDFTTSELCRGFINSSGRWGFCTPNNTLGPEGLSYVIDGINNLTLGAQGWICAEGFSVRVLNDRVTNTLDLLAVNGRSSITSNGDNNGLHIRSTSGRKIYLYDKVYFDDQFWTSLGPGRNNDPTINNANNNKMFRIGSNGAIGLWGTTGVENNDNPQLKVSGTSISTTVPIIPKVGDISLFIGEANGGKDAWIGASSSHGVHIGANNASVAYFGADNNMYVGLLKETVVKIRQELRNKYKLFVAGGVLSEDYGISPKSTWSDFVFNTDYALKTIPEVEEFISENNHLPDVPSAKQVAEDGYSQHDMNKILLQKIEELTLYTIQQQKEIEALKTQLQESKK